MLATLSVKHAGGAAELWRDFSALIHVDLLDRNTRR